MCMQCGQVALWQLLAPEDARQNISNCDVLSFASLPGQYLG